MSSIAPQNAPKSAKRSASGDLLLEAASRILAERNVIDVSLSEIAGASGLNSALIKYHFGSKDGLLLALVRRDATAALLRLDELVRMNLPPEQKVRLHVAGIINTYTRSPYLNRLIHTLLTHSDEKITQQIADFFVRPLIESQTKILEEGVALGIFRRLDPLSFYYSMVGACEHFFFGRYAGKFLFGIEDITPKVRESYIEFVCDMTLRMLRRN
jgi:TetR/AcrR family transcriptional regulator